MKVHKIFSFIVILFFLNLQNSLACICLLPPPPCYAYSESEAVFVGTVKNVIRDDENIIPKVVVEIEQNFKGMKGKTAYTYNYATSCHWSFDKNDKFLFYTDLDEKDKNYFFTSYCTRTQKFEDDLVDFEFLNSVKNSTPNYLIWGQTSYDNQPLKEIQAQVFDDKKKLVGISDENGDLKISVSKEGIYKVRVFPPKGTQMDFTTMMNSAFREKVKSLKDYNFEKNKPFAEYEIEVKADNCGWFYLPLQKYEKE